MAGRRVPWRRTRDADTEKLHKRVATDRGLVLPVVADPGRCPISQALVLGHDVLITQVLGSEDNASVWVPAVAGSEVPGNAVVRRPVGADAALAVEELPDVLGCGRARVEVGGDAPVQAPSSE
jgi:hypothetical protein